ncbi:MAG: hypothetical protein F6J97_23170, partial [Leptolyngbya sp. SIO4C1]|nr:hypothetical protein [Leptolyngbya sp. SIO4C1]
MKRWKQRLIGSLCLGASLGVAPQVFAEQPQRAIQLAQSYTSLISNTLFRHYALRYPAPVLTSGLSAQQAGQLQVAFVRQLREELGPVVGFKAALTSSAAQAQFGVNHPLYG